MGVFWCFTVVGVHKVTDIYIILNFNLHYLKQLLYHEKVES